MAMRVSNPKPIIEVDAITRVSQPMQYGDIFKCANGHIWMAEDTKGVNPTAVALITNDGTWEEGVEGGQRYALKPETIKPPYTLIVSLKEHLHE